MDAQSGLEADTQINLPNFTRSSSMRARYRLFPVSFLTFCANRRRRMVARVSRMMSGKSVMYAPVSLHHTLVSHTQGKQKGG